MDQFPLIEKILGLKNVTPGYTEDKKWCIGGTPKDVKSVFGAFHWEKHNQFLITEDDEFIINNIPDLIEELKKLTTEKGFGTAKSPGQAAVKSMPKYQLMLLVIFDHTADKSKIYLSELVEKVSKLYTTKKSDVSTLAGFLFMHKKYIERDYCKDRKEYFYTITEKGKEFAEFLKEGLTE